MRNDQYGEDEKGKSDINYVIGYKENFSFSIKTLRKEVLGKKLLSLSKNNGFHNFGFRIITRCSGVL